MRSKRGLTLIEILIAAGLVLIIGSGVFFFAMRNNKEDGYVACTLEAKLCPDGSAVGRTGPNCEFAACPEVGQEKEMEKNKSDAETSSFIQENVEVREEIFISEEQEVKEESSPEQEFPIVPSINTSNTVEWRAWSDGWRPSVTPPACPTPLELKIPVDLSLVTSVLYPGQYRGGDYKPHGGFRFDNSKNEDIVVIAPMDARIVDGGRYYVGGEIQYTFDFIASCGIMYRFGHLLELSPKFAAIAETFPAPREGDSRTYGVESYSTVTAGEIIGTAVGLRTDDNTFVDWGVYDLRSKNSVSEDSAWVLEHQSSIDQHAVCWFDMLSSSDETIVRSLPPADGVSGSMSDFCN